MKNIFVIIILCLFCIGCQSDLPYYQQNDDRYKSFEYDIELPVGIRESLDLPRIYKAVTYMVHMRSSNIDVYYTGYFQPTLVKKDDLPGYVTFIYLDDDSKIVNTITYHIKSKSQRENYRKEYRKNYF